MTTEIAELPLREAAGAFATAACDLARAVEAERAAREAHMVKADSGQWKRSRGAVRDALAEFGRKLPALTALLAPKSCDNCGYSGPDRNPDAYPGEDCPRCGGEIK